MCEILVRTKTNGAVGKHYQYGDPVVAMPDGHTWGTSELDPNEFAVVYLPTMTLEEGKALCETITDIDGSMLRRRRYNFTPFVKAGEQQPVETLMSRLVDHANSNN